MNLNTFVAAYIDKTTQTRRDYTGSLGWVHLGNLILSDWINKGYISRTMVKEIGVEVSNGFFITLPSDLAEVLKVYSPISFKTQEDHEIADHGYRWEIVNGKIKLTEWVDKDDDPETKTFTAISTTGFSALDAASVVNEWEAFLAVFYSGLSIDPQIILSNAVHGATTTAFTFLNTLSTSPSVTVKGCYPGSYSNLADLVSGESLSNGNYFYSRDGSDLPGGELATAKGSAVAVGDLFELYALATTARYIEKPVYLTEEYLMLKYTALFTTLSSETSALPFDERYYSAFAAELYLRTCQKSDPKTYAVLKRERDDAVENLELMVFTPTEDNARPQPRSLPGYQDSLVDEDDKFPENPLYD